MATTLTANITASQTSFATSGSVIAAPVVGTTGAGLFLQIGSEVIEVSGYGGNGFVYGCHRGALGTTAATHSAGAAVTAYSAGSGGGSISVTDGTTTIAALTSLRLPSGTLSDNGGGEGGIFGDPVVTWATPDGAEAAGSEALQIQGETARPLLTVDAYGTLQLIGAVVDKTNGGSALVLKDTSGAQTRYILQADTGDNAAGSGTSFFSLDLVIRGGSTAPSGTMSLGFFAKTPVTQPAAPTTLADVIAALKTLGLVAS